ncbi:MAG: helix-turn-helix domain-containing protein [Acidimicrobiales bacterium]
MTTTVPHPSPFGALLREWRRLRGVSQLELAGLVASTPRHISFIETGRSRPRRPLVLRLSRALTLPQRESNELLIAAGLPPEFTEDDLGADDLGPYRQAIDALLTSHTPFPGCVVDRWGQILLANEPFERINPGMAELTPEELLEATFGSDEGRARVLNWDEIAWAYVDRMSTVLTRTPDSRIEALVVRVREHLGGRERPPASTSPHLSAVFLGPDGQTLSTFTTFLRFDYAHDVSLSELAVELIFPADETTRTWFETTPD